MFNVHHNFDRLRLRKETKTNFKHSSETAQKISVTEAR